ncbi:hypothetical protein BDZ97DRAFT_1810872 [Flammula alnicola]|nr:hypothetical protein BDZ97DRAFT_1810872 [Flammula alnicola]
MTAYETNTQPARYDSTTHSSKVLDTFGGRWSAENDSFDGHYNSVAYATTREHFSKEGFLHGHLAFHQNYNVLTLRTQHQPVPPEQRSKYSELSLNLEFMDRLKQEEQASSRRRQSCHSLSTVAAASPLPLSSPKKRRRSQELFPPSADIERPSTGRIICMSISDDPPDPAHDLWIPTQLTFVDSPNTPSTPTASSSSSSQAESSVTRNVKEPKKPSLACTFVGNARSRVVVRPKVAPTRRASTQCARRSFKCEYLNEQQRAKSSKHSRRRRR